MAAGIFVGTVGLRIRVSLGVDVSATGAVKIRYEKPNGTDTGEWVAVKENPAVGTIYYDTLVDDLDEAGVWKLNGIWDPDGDNIFYGATACLTVRELGDSC